MNGNVDGPFTPDFSHPLSSFAKSVKDNKWPTKLQSALIGSCTNSSYEDMARSASLVSQAVKHGLNVKSHFTITPGSEQIRATIARDGQMKTFTDAGGVVLGMAAMTSRMTLK